MNRLFALCIFCVVIGLSGMFSVRAQRAYGDKSLLTTQQLDTSRVLIYVNDTTSFNKWISSHLPHIRIERNRDNKKVLLLSYLRQGDYDLIRQFARYVNPNRKAFPEREVGGMDLTLNTVTTVRALYPEVDGGGLIVSVKENPFDKNDIDFFNRVFQPGSIPASSDIHATIMATIIGGAGNSSVEGRGVAPNSTIAFADFSNLLPGNTNELKTNGITVQNHSYGVGIENYYGIETHQYDKQTRDYPELVHVFSSGNDGNETSNEGPYAGVPGYANLTGQFKMSKNTVSVGSTNSLGELATLSSRGPAYDGRIKPEVVAHGDQGTSESAAIVSGIALLLQQTHRDEKGSVPPSSLVRAALINSADDGGRVNVDYEFGFGSVDALGSVKTLRDERYFIDAVDDSESKTFLINVPENSNELKITLAWTDTEAEPGSVKALVNDLDLQLLHLSSSTTFAPWVLSIFPHADSLKKPAVRKQDHLNTIEQVTLLNPEPGDYQIQIKGFDVPSGPQQFSVVYEIADQFQWTYPFGSDVLPAGESKILRWKWRSPSTPGRLEWSVAGENSWQPIGDINMISENFIWNIPAINDVVEIKLSWGTNEFVTDKIRVSVPLFPAIGYYCEPDGLVFWNDHGSDSYHVYRLGEKFLELTEDTQDTVYSFSSGNDTPPFVSVAGVVKGKEGLRSRSVDLRNGVCYITSFLPERVVTDSVSLLLTLGTIIGVNSFDLLRLSATGPVVVQTIEPVSMTDFKLYDPSPQSGLNRYQIRLTRTGGENVFSQEEEVLFVREDDMQFFPNPVTAGESVSVVVNTSISEFWIHDVLGKPVRASIDDAELKTIQTSGLAPGMYIVKSISPSGKVLTGRIIIK